VHFLECPALNLSGDAFRQVRSKHKSLRDFEVCQLLTCMVSQFLLAYDISSRSRTAAYEITAMLWL
jgi:hypothetical protein